MQRVITTAPTPTLEGLRTPTEFLQPVRAQCLEADVHVPLQKAKWTGILIGLATLVLVATVEHLLQREWLDLLVSSLLISTIVGLVTVVIAWFAFESMARENLYKIEQCFGIDINGDGRVGRRPRATPVLVNPYRGRARQKQDLQKQWQTKFANFVRGCFENNNTSGTFWIREGRMNANDYAEFRDKLLAAGYAHKIHGGRTSGWQFMNTLTADDIIDTALRDNIGEENEFGSESSSTNEN